MLPSWVTTCASTRLWAYEIPIRDQEKIFFMHYSQGILAMTLTENIDNEKLERQFYKASSSKET